MRQNHYCHFGCKEELTIILAPGKCLLAESYYILIWHTMIDLRLSRRRLAEEIVNIFRDVCCTKILDALGGEYILPEFDEVFTDDDSRRWFGDYMRCDKSGGQPKYISQLVPRLEVLDLAAKIINPKPFRAIGQMC